jgi:hypothetical protein
MRGILVGGGRASRLFGALIAAFWLWLALPLATGERTLLLRDVFSTHLPLKSFGAAELAEGRVPALHPAWALGQPFRGNPNALPFYPGNLLYLALPFWSAFNLHYALHWALAFLGMHRLARVYGQGPEAALVAAFAYAASGWTMTALTFMNILTVSAWAPWVLAAIAAGSRRAALVGGVACGLMLLGGEPIVAALAVPVMALVAVERHGWRRGLARAAAVGALGLLVALPQVVATARVLPFSYRAAHGLAPGTVVANDLHPLRLLELVLPMPWGWPADMGRFAFWAPRVNPHVPYVYSLHVGLVGFALALFAARARARWAALAATCLALAWALGLSESVTHGLTAGLFRYPQKLLFPFTLAAAMLAGFGVERALAIRRPRTPWLAGAAVAALAALGLFLFHDGFSALLREHLVAARSELVARTQAMHWLVIVACAAALLLGAAWAAARRSALGLAVAQALCMLQMAPAWVTDSTDHYRSDPALLASVGEPRAIAQVPTNWPYWEERAGYRTAAHNPVVQARISRADLDPSFLTFDRLDHVTAPDLEGMTSPLTVFLNNNLTLADWDVRVRWLRRLGAGWILRNSPAQGPALPVVAAEERFGVRTELLRVPDPLPRVGWPARLVVVSSPIDAWRAVAAGRFDDATAIASRPIHHEPGGSVRLVAEDAGRVELEVESGGGLAVVRRTYWPLLRARLGDGTRLETQPVDLALLGIEVPAGRHRVIVDVSSRPEAAAGIAALVAAAFALGLAARASRGSTEARAG